MDRIKLYNIKKNKLNIAGLLPIKDFNFAVIDNTNYIQTKGTIKKINEIDEYSIDKTYSGEDVSNIRKETSPENFYQYVNLATNDNILDKTNCIKKINKLYEEGNKKMDIPLVVPINCKWKINGKDILHNEIKSSVFSPLSYSYYLQINNSKYNIFGCEFNEEKDLSSLINKGDEQYLTIRDYILNSNGNVYDIIDEKYFSKLYYNKAFNKLEVIFSGQKMEMSNNELDLSNYEGYMFSIIKSKSVNISSTNVEFIIDNDNKVIVCIWYIGGKIDSEEQDWKKTNCVSDLSYIYNKKYIPFANCDENEKDKIKDTSIFISLLGKNDKENNYTYNFKVTDINDYALNGEKYYISINDNKDQIVGAVDIEKCKNNSIIYIKDSSKELIINNNLKTFDNVLQNSTISFYIKGENNNFNSKNIFQINFIDPINVRETLPLKIFGDITYDEYFTYNGYIQPEIKNIFEFTKIEKDVSNTTKINFNGTNISVSKINKINQLWFNKVSDEDDYSYKEKDFAMLCIDYKKEFGLFDNCWQENFYTKYFRNRKCKSVNGYESNRSVKTFFNSQGMVVNNDRIEIQDWYNNYTVSFKDKTYFERKSNKERNNVVITLDVSKTILDKLKKESTILSNWKFNDKALLFSDEYISNIIKNVYDINLKNNISIYRSKKQKNDIDVVPYLEDTFEKIENIKNELVIVNDKYLLKIYVPNDNYDYAIKYIIYK